MSMPSMGSIAFNGAGIAMGLFVVAGIVKPLLESGDMPACSKRYPAGLSSSLTTEDGRPMSPAELQARTGAESFGMFENATVVAPANENTPPVLQVTLRKGTTLNSDGEIPKGGIAYRWQPSGMDNAKSACLAYTLFLPEDFNFGESGVLPGFFGTGTPAPVTDEEEPKAPEFTTRLSWRNDGSGGIALRLPREKDPFTLLNGSGQFDMPRGRWIEIEQELMLNAPGEANGEFRLWLDGRLMVDQRDVAWRNDESMKISGVLADVSYGGNRNHATAPADTTLGLTPLSVSWN